MVHACLPTKAWKAIANHTKCTQDPVEVNRYGEDKDQDVSIIPTGGTANIVYVNLEGCLFTLTQDILTAHNPPADQFVTLFAAEEGDPDHGIKFIFPNSFRKKVHMYEPDSPVARDIAVDELSRMATCGMIKCLNNGKDADRWRARGYVVYVHSDNAIPV
jgi:hypothetical protein